MNINFKQVFLILAISLILSLASATEEDLGIFKVKECVELKQICANCTYVNISSVLYPNSTEAISNIQMTKEGTDYNYTLCNVTSVTGEYIVNGYGDPDGITTIFAYKFTLTPTGTILSISEGIMYSIFISLLVFLFILSLIGAINIEWRNQRNSEGNIIGVNDLKYFKLILSFASYILFMFITSTTYSLIQNFTFFSGFANIVNWLYYILLACLLPVIVLTILIGVVSFISDKKVWKILDRGLSVK